MERDSLNFLRRDQLALKNTHCSIEKYSERMPYIRGALFGSVNEHPIQQ